MSGAGDRQRRGWFTLAAAVLVGAALLLSAFPSRPTPTTTTTATTTATTTPPLTLPTPPLEPTTTPATVPERAPAATRPPARELRRVARRFLGGYLAHVYGRGRGHARRIDGAARALRRRLLHENRRRPGRRSGRRGRVRSLRLGGYVADARAWVVTARITDGRNVAYPVELLLGRREDRLVVIAIGSVD